MGGHIPVYSICEQMHWERRADRLIFSMAMKVPPVFTIRPFEFEMNKTQLLREVLL